jgi:beta-N-acetylhexosaminidase
VSDLDPMAHRVVMASFAGPVAPDWVLDRLRSGLGSVALFGSNVSSLEQVAELTASLRAAGPDVLVATDEEGGDVTRLHMTTGSPAPGNAALGAVDSVSLTAAVAASIGHELASVGVDLDLAPVVDVNSNPDNPVIGVRSFGASPDLVARHTHAWVDGLQSAGVGACVKHFPGHGDTAVDSHLGLPTVDVPLEVLRARELVPFAAAVEARAVAVMTSHVLLPALDPALPATLSPTVLRTLRDELGFDGLVVSDALDMAGASAGRGVPAAAVLATAAGCDLLCLGADKTAEEVDAVVRALVDAVRSGELAESRLVDAGSRVAAASERVRGWRGGGAFPGDDESPARVAATRALAVDGGRAVVGALGVDGPVAAGGALPDQGGAVVLRFRTGTYVAVGQVPWGLPVDGSVLGGREHLDVTEESDVEEVVRQAELNESSGAGTAGRRPIVALVREAHRHSWVLAALTSLAADRPDLVTVEMGWPGPTRLPGAAVVRTYGASKANGEALDALLSGGAAEVDVPVPASGGAR